MVAVNGWDIHSVSNTYGSSVITLDGGNTYRLETYSSTGINIPVGNLGMQTTITNLKVGTTYRFTSFISGGVSFNANQIQRYQLTVASGGTPSTTSAVDMPTSGNDLDFNAFPVLQFVATATSAVIRFSNAVALNTTPFVPYYSQSVRFFGMKLEEYKGGASAIGYYLQDTVYESSLVNHFTLASVSVGGYWYVDRNGVCQFSSSYSSTPRAVFTDVRAPGKYEYQDLKVSYDTKNTINILDVNNKGKSNVPSESKANDATSRYADSSSIATFGNRLGSIDTNISNGLPGAVEAYNLQQNPAFYNGIGEYIGGGANNTSSLIKGAPGVIPAIPWVYNYGRTIWSVAGGGGFYSRGDTNNPATPVTAGQQYVMSAYVKASVAKAVTISMQFANAAGANIGSVNSTTFNLVANTWTRISHVFTAPAGAVTGGVYSYATTNWAAGNIYEWTAISVMAGNTLTDYFDGNKPYTATLAYDWQTDAGVGYSKMGTNNMAAIATQILQRNSVPRIQFSKMRFNAQQDMKLSQSLELYDSIVIEFRGQNQIAYIIGMSEDIKPSRWMIDLELIILG